MPVPTKDEIRAAEKLTTAVSEEVWNKGVPQVLGTLLGLIVMRLWNPPEMEAPAPELDEKEDPSTYMSKAEKAIQASPFDGSSWDVQALEFWLAELPEKPTIVQRLEIREVFEAFMSNQACRNGFEAWFSPHKEKSVVRNDVVFWVAEDLYDKAMSHIVSGGGSFDQKGASDILKAALVMRASVDVLVWDTLNALTPWEILKGGPIRKWLAENPRPLRSAEE